MGYYVEKLSGKRLRECYRIAPPRVRQYLRAELDFLLEHVARGDDVLELGCGYGRVVLQLAGRAAKVVGIDTAPGNLALARELAAERMNCAFELMDAVSMDFEDDRFDVVACVQNGICAFGVEQLALLREALRVTRPGGSVLFSSYSDRFWEHRLAWFELQAEHGLVGELDRERTGDGTIACLDGFRSGRMTPDGFRSLCARLDVEPEITEVDESSVFCRVVAE